MMERKMVLTAVVLLGLLCAAVAQAELYIPTSFGAGADTWVANCAGSSQWEVTDNYGGEGRMRIRYNGGGSRFMAGYLRFDLSGGEIFGADTRLQLTTSWMPNDGSVTTKDIHRPARTGKTLYIYGLTDDDVDDAWVEGNGIEKTAVTDTSFITYANAPGMVATDPLNSGNYAIDGRLTLLGTIKTPTLADHTTGSGTAEDPYIYDLIVTFWSAPSQALADFLNNDGNGVATLVLIERDGIASANSEAEFQTKENTLGSPPALVPEPATMLIFGLGSLLLARAKRR